MKKFLFAAAAVSLIATPAFAAPGNDHRGNSRGHVSARAPVAKAPIVKVPVRYTPPLKQVKKDRRWKRGERFDYRQARNYRQIDWHKQRGLKAPPKGYRYVQSGNDAVLVGVTTGVVLAVIAGLFH